MDNYGHNGPSTCFTLLLHSPKCAHIHNPSCRLMAKLGKVPYPRTYYTGSSNWKPKPSNCMTTTLPINLHLIQRTKLN